MTEQAAVDLAQGAVVMAVTLGGPSLAVILIVGVAVSVFQAMTQINETTLSFVPKIVALGALLVVLGPWMLQSAVTYAVSILSNLAVVTR
jgi:flagellar biosynthetic protein FliQ